MDTTALFRACTKAMRMRKKKEIEEDKPKVLHAPCPYSKQAKDIVADITQLRDFLLKNRKEYVNVNHLSSMSSALSDFDRDRIDSDAEAAIRSCSQLVKTLERSVKSDESSQPQLHRHRQIMIEVLNAYLKAVCRIYSEQRAVRVKKASDMKRMSRLSALVKSSAARPKPPPLRPSTQGNVALDDDVQSHSLDPDHPGLRHRKMSSDVASHGDENSAASDRVNSANVIYPKAASKRDVNDWEDAKIKEEVENFTEEERQQLTKENDQLFQKVNLMVDEIQQIEGKVIEIARLQEVFTEKVLEQEGDIYRVNEVAIHTTENLKSGNDQIREALKHKASMRVYIIFFLLVLTFTLVFLDWYNP
uniref:SNARE-complex protein Syntaxin-18 N-terminal domain-containing protein n=1 Tax=Plectus sambesii TaxID=2011161 RepID=A0A914VVH2_9BILA